MSEPTPATAPRCPFCLFPPEEGHGDDCPGMYDTTPERVMLIAELLDRNVRHLRLAAKLDGQPVTAAAPAPASPDLANELRTLIAHAEQVTVALEDEIYDSEVVASLSRAVAHARQALAARCPYCVELIEHGNQGHADDCPGAYEVWFEQFQGVPEGLTLLFEEGYARGDWREQLTEVANKLLSVAAWPTPHPPGSRMEQIALDAGATHLG